MVGATLFSGIGAPECAAPEINWLWCAEIEKFPSAVLAERLPETPNLGDVTADDFYERAERAGRPDILVFGSPCQDFSVAGKRLGIQAPRGNLALVALGIAERLRPRWLVFENVPGLLSNWSGIEAGEVDPERGWEGDENSDFAAFLGEVEKCGYLGVWRVLDAQFAGLAQRRERVFFVGYLGDWRPPAAVLLEPESLSGNSAPSRETGEGVAPTIAARTQGGGGLGTDFDCDGGLIPEISNALCARDFKGARPEADQGAPLIASHDVAQPLLGKANSSHRADAESYVAHTLRADGFDASEDGTGRGTPIVPQPIPLQEVNGRMSKNQNGIGMGVGADGDVMYTLQSGQQHGVACFDPNQVTSKANRSKPKPELCHTLPATENSPIAFGWNKSQSQTMRAGEKADALQASPTSNPAVVYALSTQQEPKWGKDVCPTLALPSKSGGGQVTAVADQWAVRRLTPRECERLQGFPHDFTNITYRGKPAADGPRYKAIGNSMAVPVMRWILTRIVEIDELVSATASEGRG